MVEVRQASRSLRRLPESKLQGRIEFAILGVGYPLPAGMTALVHNNMGLPREILDPRKCRLCDFIQHWNQGFM